MNEKLLPLVPIICEISILFSLDAQDLAKCFEKSTLHSTLYSQSIIDANLALNPSHHARWLEFEQEKSSGFSKNNTLQISAMIEVLDFMTVWLLPPQSQPPHRSDLPQDDLKFMPVYNLRLDRFTKDTEQLKIQILSLSNSSSLLQCTQKWLKSCESHQLMIYALSGVNKTESY